MGYQDPALAAAGAIAAPVAFGLPPVAPTVDLTSDASTVRYHGLKIEFSGTSLTEANAEAAVEDELRVIKRMLTQLDNKFDKIDVRFDRIDVSFDRMEAKFDRMEATTIIAAASIVATTIATNRSDQVKKIADDVRALTSDVKISAQRYVVALALISLFVIMAARG